MFGFFVWNGIPEHGSLFWKALGLMTLILTVAALCFFRAVQISSLSDAVPMLAFTPLFMLISSPLILKERPEPQGVLGILLIVSGSYVLNFGKRDRGLWEPFLYLWRNRGSRMMLFVALLYSIGANIDKIGVRNSSPAMWIFSVNVAVSIVLACAMIWRVRHPVAAFRSAWRPLVLMGLFIGIALTCQMYAIRLTLVPYVIAIKRTSVVLTVLFVLFLFKEKRKVPERFFGVVLMVIGVCIISFFVSA